MEVNVEVMVIGLRGVLVEHLECHSVAVGL